MRPRMGWGSSWTPYTPSYEEPQRGHQTTGRYRTTTTRRPEAGYQPPLGLDAFRLRQGRGKRISCFRTSITGLDEFHFDGYRFDGVTSMILPHHHG